jgi:hypothetical protein
MSAGNRFIEQWIAIIRKSMNQPRPAAALCASAPTATCITPKLLIAATLSLCGCPDVAPMPTPSPSAVMPPRYVAPARDTATTQQMLHYYFVQ